MEYDPELCNIPYSLIKQQVEQGEAIFVLAPGETAWNPVSTKHYLIFDKSVRLTYTSYDDGGINCTVEDL